jgi:hypothetical protein
MGKNEGNVPAPRLGAWQAAYAELDAIVQAFQDDEVTPGELRNMATHSFDLVMTVKKSALSLPSPRNGRQDVNSSCSHEERTRGSYQGQGVPGLRGHEPRPVWVQRTDHRWRLRLLWVHGAMEAEGSVTGSDL